MAAAACGQRTKSQRNSGWSPSKKGGGPNWGRAERLDSGALLYLTDGQFPLVGTEDTVLYAETNTLNYIIEWRLGIWTLSLWSEVG